MMCHLMFGTLALTMRQILILVVIRIVGTCSPGTDGILQEAHIKRNRIFMHYFCKQLFVMLCIALLSIPVAWASKTDVSSDNGWSFSIAPYL